MSIMLSPETRPKIRSAWPTPIGKPLTNRMISKYKKQGFYATNVGSDGSPRTRRSKTADKKISRTLADLA